MPNPPSQLSQCYLNIHFKLFGRNKVIYLPEPFPRDVIIPYPSIAECFLGSAERGQWENVKTLIPFMNNPLLTEENITKEKTITNDEASKFLTILAKSSTLGDMERSGIAAKFIEHMGHRAKTILNSPIGFKQTPISLAIEAQQKRFVKILYTNGAKVVDKSLWNKHPWLRELAREDVYWNWGGEGRPEYGSISDASNGKLVCHWNW